MELNLKLSQIGQKMSRKVGVRAIMGDIQEVLASGSDQYTNLSVGNPSILPEVTAVWESKLKELLLGEAFPSIISQYGSSYGTDELIESVVRFFNNEYGLTLDRSNVLITAGSQNLFFLAINAFCGVGADSKLKKALIPMLPDYSGYSGVALDETMIEGISPIVSKLDDHTFRYELDKEAFLEKMYNDPDIGAVVLSRPNNPCGNILSEEDVEAISKVCGELNIPCLIDSAYAPPFPAINFVEMEPVFHESIIHCLSISKTGLAGERVGIAIGSAAFIQIMEAFQSNASIHSSRLGQCMVAAAINDGSLVSVSKTSIRPYYKKKFAVLEEALINAMPLDKKWFLHKGEGSLFAWIWFEDLPVGDMELYETLKAHYVIVVPGSSFFHNTSKRTDHEQRCIRISLTVSDEEMRKGIKTLAAVISSIYDAHKESLNMI
ncbi:valine--pyruvate transaminase [Bacillus atrophaeus]|uniref:valine--pyruvate transaminase n=1 Tax=Bacillus atrophaeus TaxID=1452 RepID=UPI002E22B0FF|nr:valine--pyruvate transaminase [Bacillus atrophaeus]MED4799308.1 valine--pyruvate transaminase [Bacillus atrophaeus]MED4820669.1 valine--pyruvate transaminase [Bacillus atrophaeus]